MIRVRVAATAALLLLGGCAYFNAMYNAERRFADARRAAARGDTATARAAWAEAIEKAGRSYRADPEGRWADDALFLVGQARFHLREYDHAAAAMRRLIDRHTAFDQRAVAFAYFGAASVALGRPAVGAAALDTAAALGELGTLEPFVALWRGRAAHASGDAAAGRIALQRAAAAPGAIGLEAKLELAARSVATADSGHARTTLATLLLDRNAAASADSIRAIARAAAQRWGDAFAYAALAPALGAPWPIADRMRIALDRAGFAAGVGDTAAAIAEAGMIAELATGVTAAEARVRAARWRLAGADRPADLAPIRAALEPAAAGHLDALALLRWIDITAVLVDFANARAQPAGLFAAAEVARDSLRSPALARRLFLTFADAAGSEPWTGKALLAALPLAPEAAADSLRHRIARRTADVYVQALWGGADPEAFAAAEQTLDRTLLTLRFDAALEAERRATALVQSAALPAGAGDSLRRRAAADSARRRKGLVVDTVPRARP